MSHDFKLTTVDSATLTATQSDSTVTASVTRTDEFKVARELATKIQEYDENYFIVLVSNNAWEHYFSENLGDVLSRYGGQNIREFTYEHSIRFGEKTKRLYLDGSDKIEHRNIHHPFTFVGVKGLPPGKGFE